MGVEIAREGRGSRLRVFIDYELPEGWVTSCLGWLFGRFYAHGVLDQMLTGALKEFTTRHAAAA